MVSCPAPPLCGSFIFANTNLLIKHFVVFYFMEPHVCPVCPPFSFGRGCGGWYLWREVPREGGRSEGRARGYTVVAWTFPRLHWCVAEVTQGHRDAALCAGNNAGVGLVAEVEAAGRSAEGGARGVISASGPPPPSVASRPLGGSPPPPGSPRPSRAPGRRGRRRAVLRASVRAHVRTSASRSPARAPRHRGRAGAGG